MSLQEISRSIKNFFESKGPTIYCLSGEWGVGKTYLFNEISKKYFSEKIPSEFHSIKLPKNNLIKISLFGVSSVDDLKHKIIAEKLENSEAINLVSKALKYSLNHAKLKVPFVDFDQKKILESLFFNKFSNDLLICFDDIERKSPSLRIIDFLGFVSMLKEKYNCKIFLILNDHILDDENKNDYKKYFEKVVDHHIKFISNPRDSLKITLEKHSFDEGIKNLLIKKIEFLNITNIRIIDKILTHSRLLLDRLDQAIKPKVEQETIDQTLIALCLFCDGFYSLSNLNNEDKPAIEDILNPENKIYNNKKQQNFLWNLGYIETELFQIKIYEFILNGFFDSNFDQIANEYNKKFEIGTKQYKYNESWRVGFHGSLKDNGDEVVGEIYRTFIDGIEVMTIRNLSPAYSLLNEYGWNDKANEVKNLYYEKHKTDQEKFNIHDIYEADNQEMKNFCKDSLQKIKLNNRPNIEIAVENFLKNKSNPDNNDYLRQLSEEEFYKFFKDEKSKIDNHNKLYLAKHFDNAKSTLEKIGKESKINKLRIEYPSGGFKLKP